jgi:hypothetical protein
MKPVRYVLEVRRPDNYSDVWALFEAATPWVAIHVGDLIDPGNWPGSQSPKRVLRVIRVEHVVVDEGPQLAQCLRIATEEVDGYPRVDPA